ncbi:MAG: hypothetical protein AAB955_01335, partial [Patescibacteria group bacterium]
MRYLFVAAVLIISAFGIAAPALAAEATAPTRYTVEQRAMWQTAYNTCRGGTPENNAPVGRGVVACEVSATNSTNGRITEAENTANESETHAACKQYGWSGGGTAYLGCVIGKQFEGLISMATVYRVMSWIAQFLHGISAYYLSWAVYYLDGAIYYFVIHMGTFINDQG